MNAIDLNADLGEGMPSDQELIMLISSANIACGYHAGDKQMMERTIKHCIRHKVAVGAHPSFPDREHFGRREMYLEEGELLKVISEQLNDISKICQKLGVVLHHVKPHGALYNMASRDATIASHVAKAVRLFNIKLIYFGLANSVMIEKAREEGLKTVSEFFADRRYDDDGKLLSRSHPESIIEHEDDVLEQVKLIVQQRSIRTVSGRQIRLCEAEDPVTICLHGDGPNAIRFAYAIKHLFQTYHIIPQSY